MLRLRFLLIHVLLLLAAGSMYGQSNTSPCSAICLDTSGIINTKNPAANPGTNLPCGGGGTTEDNPLWWAFTTGDTTTSVIFNVVASNCIDNRGIQVSIWEGDNCASIVFVGQCVSGFGGEVVADVTPCRTYFLQLDGLAGDICNVKVTYPPSQIRTSWVTPTINGPSEVCAGSSVEYTIMPTGGCIPTVIEWTTQGGLPAILTTQSPAPHKIAVKFPNPGTYKVCTVGNSQCFPTGTKVCKSVLVFALPDVNDNLTLCAEESIYKYCNIQVKANEAMAGVSAQYGIFPNLIGAATPTCFDIILPSIGGIINKVVPYTTAPSGCKGKINVKIDVVPLQKIPLGNFAICEGDNITIAGKNMNCTNSSYTTQSVKVVVPGGYPNCDTTYTFKLFCLKINPSIAPIAALYATHTSDTLRASAIVSPINTFNNTGKITYKWNTGSTNSKIFVNKPGVYTVSVTYAYTITELPNNPNNPSIKTCTKSISYTVINAPIGSVVYKCSKTKPYTYTAIVSFSGGKAPYYVNNKLIKLSYYSIPNIPNGQSFTQTFKDSNGQSFTVTGFKVCDGTNLQAQDKATEMEAETMESAPNIEILDNKIVNLNEDWRIENVTIYNLQGQRLCAFDNTENLDLQACMAQYPTSMYIIKTTLVSEKGEKRMVVKKLSVGN